MENLRLFRVQSNERRNNQWLEAAKAVTHRIGNRADLTRGMSGWRDGLFVQLKFQQWAAQQVQAEVVVVDFLEA